MSTDLPEGAEWRYGYRSGEAVYNEPQTWATERVRRVVGPWEPVPDPQPPSLAERMMEWWDAAGGGGEPRVCIFNFQRMVKALGLVSRDDPDFPGDEWVSREAFHAERDELRANWRVEVENYESQLAEGSRAEAEFRTRIGQLRDDLDLVEAQRDGLQEALTEAGVASVPSVSQVMEALGFEIDDVDGFQWVSDRSFRGVFEASGRLTAIGIRPDEETP